MNLLFVCKQNVGRSQIANAFYNELTYSADADAAGTTVDAPGQTLLERKATSKSKNFFVLDVMSENGIDISSYVRAPLEESQLDTYDVVINMAQPDDTPGWLLVSSKYLYLMSRTRADNILNTLAKLEMK